MSAAVQLINKNTVEQVIGKARLRRLLRAGWLAPAGRNAQAILFSPHDLHAALRRLERSVLPPDRIEVARVRAWEMQNGRAYVKHPRKPKPPLELEWDLSNLEREYKA
jgi:hypothetical protein